MRNQGIALTIHDLPHVLAGAIRGDRGLDSYTVRQEFASWVVCQRDGSRPGRTPGTPGPVHTTITLDIIEAYILCRCRAAACSTCAPAFPACATCMARKQVWVRAVAMWQPTPRRPKAAAAQPNPYLNDRRTT